jgi:uncharacterized protein
MNTTSIQSIADRLEAMPWQRIYSDLEHHGYATTDRLFNADECQKLMGMYAESSLFRSQVIMQNHSYGSGEYQYFAYPLPEIVDSLRRSMYLQLVAIANQWHTSLQRAIFPPTLSEFSESCHIGGQTKPTPLLLKYEADDYNCLHQDLYGELTFPLQVAILLSDPDREFTGGEFVLLEQRVRKQSKVEVVRLLQGQAVIFAVNHKPVQSKRGISRVNIKHGVSRILSGQRFCLGVIFHDAK